MRDIHKFTKELEELIAKHELDTETSIPSFVLAALVTEDIAKYSQLNSIFNYMPIVAKKPH